MNFVFVLFAIAFVSVSNKFKFNKYFIDKKIIIFIESI